MISTPVLLDTGMLVGAAFPAQSYLAPYAPNSYVTVQATPTWWLNDTNAIPGGSSTPKAAVPITGVNSQLLPFRWFTSSDYNPLTSGTSSGPAEIAIPFVKQVVYDDDLNQDAASLTVQVFNQNATFASYGGSAYAAPSLSSSPPSQPQVLGDPGFFSFLYGGIDPLTSAAQAKLWGRTAKGAAAGGWTNVLREGALLRWYFGYGGVDLSWADAFTAGNVMLKGLWLVDLVSIESNGGYLTLTCRCAGGKLLLDQILCPPLVPQDFYTSSGIVFYPPQYNTYDAQKGYGAPGETIPIDPITTILNKDGIWKSVIDAAVAVDGQGYMLCGSNGRTFGYSDTVFEYGGVPQSGESDAISLLAPIAGMDLTSSGNGYWICDQIGTIYNFGDAVNYTNAGITNSATPDGQGFFNALPGSYWAPGAGAPNPAGLTVESGVTNPIVAFRRSATGSGYYMLAQDGTVTVFGDAVQYGPGGAGAVKMAVPPQGGGYWILSCVVAGTAAAPTYTNSVVGWGSCSNLGAPSTGAAAAIESTTQGTGYWIVSNSNPNGSGVSTITAYGNAPEYSVSGSDEGALFQNETLNAPCSTIRVLPDGTGFYVVGMDGGVFSFGSANYFGSMPKKYWLWIPSNYVSWFNTDPGGIYIPIPVTTPTATNPPANATLVLSSSQSTENGQIYADPVLLAPDYCVDEKTEALTRRGWLKYDQIHEGDEVLGVDPETGKGAWHKVNSVFRGYRENHPMVRMKGVSFDALTTRDHRWIVWRGDSKERYYWTTSDSIQSRDHIPLVVPTDHLPTKSVYDDAFVELVAWHWTEGWWTNNGGAALAQSQSRNPENVKSIMECLEVAYGPSGNMKGIAKNDPDRPWWSLSIRGNEDTINKYKYQPELVVFNLSKRIGDDLRIVYQDVKDKVVSVEFLLGLTEDQLALFISKSLLADGTCNKDRRRRLMHHYNLGDKTEVMTQTSLERIRMWEIACVLAGLPVGTHLRHSKDVDGVTKEYWSTTLYRHDYVAPIRTAVSSDFATVDEEMYTGMIWCPETELGNFVARRDGSQSQTGVDRRYQKTRMPMAGSIFLTSNSQVVRTIWSWAGGYLPESSTGGGPFTGSTGATYTNPSNPAIPTLLGQIFDSGAYDALGQIDSTTFDKVPCKQAINAMRDAIGYITRFRDDGGLVFTAPNIFIAGNNFYEGYSQPAYNSPYTGTDYFQTNYVPLFGEGGILPFQDFTLNSTDAPLRSQILVSPVDPYIYEGSPPMPNLTDAPPGLSNTVTNLIAPTVALDVLHGIVKVAMIGVPLNVPVSIGDQNLMAEFQYIQTWLATRTGTLIAPFHPGITIDSQIQIQDRVTGETSIHYVTAISVTHNLDQGDCLATYTTQWMGNIGDNGWAVGGTITDTSYNSDGGLNTPNITLPISAALTQAVTAWKNANTNLANLALSFS
jgi:hypothetical protein